MTFTFYIVMYTFGGSVGSDQPHRHHFRKSILGIVVLAAAGFGFVGAQTIADSTVQLCDADTDIPLENFPLSVVPRQRFSLKVSCPQSLCPVGAPSRLRIVEDDYSMQTDDAAHPCKQNAEVFSASSNFFVTFFFFENTFLVTFKQFQNVYHLD